MINILSHGNPKRDAGRYREEGGRDVRKDILRIRGREAFQTRGANYPRQARPIKPLLIATQERQAREVGFLQAFLLLGQRNGTTLSLFRQAIHPSIQILLRQSENRRNAIVAAGRRRLRVRPERRTEALIVNSCVPQLGFTFTSALP